MAASSLANKASTHLQGEKLEIYRKSYVKNNFGLRELAHANEMRYSSHICQDIFIRSSESPCAWRPPVQVFPPQAGGGGVQPPVIV